MGLELRSDVMRATDSRTIFLARNLVCDGTNYFDTGFAPFSTANASTDFKLTIRFNNFVKISASGNQDSIFTCKYEGTLSGQQYPGFLLRNRSTGGGTAFEIGGYNYYYAAHANWLSKNVYFWRQSGTFYSQIEGAAVQTLSVRVATFNQNIIIGAAEKTDSTKMRYGKFDLEYFRLEYL